MLQGATVFDVILINTPLYLIKKITNLFNNKLRIQLPQRSVLFSQIALPC